MPFLLPIYVLLIGVVIGHLVGRHFKAKVRLSIRSMLFGGLLLVVAALVANSAQRLYDLGLSIQSAFVAESLGIFVFSFTLAMAWSLLHPARTRWLLLLAAPIGLVQPILIAWMLVSWRLNGFAP